MNHSRVAGCLAYLLLFLVACTERGSAQGHPNPTTPSSNTNADTTSNRRFSKPPDADLRARLSPMQYDVTQRAGTERPFRNEFWDNHAAGIYVDIVTGEPLFSSLDKFDSGTGWPSFSRPIDGASITQHRDDGHGMQRTEVRSRSGSSHLGHLFNDGPTETGQRYCINSAALRFVPVDRLEAEGYPEYLARFGRKPTATTTTATPVTAATTTTTAPTTQAASAATPATPAPATPATAHARETAILAGGCFWGMEEILRKVPGVIEIDVGYTGGSSRAPDYDAVHTGRTGHAEAVRVVFDPQKLSYADLLDKWFFRMHDPTTLNRQGNDVGSQYRSAIFYTSEAQRRIAQDAKARAARSGRWSRPIVTEISAAGPFTKAEAEHQDYLLRNPRGYTCHFLRE